MATGPFAALNRACIKTFGSPVTYQPAASASFAVNGVLQKDTDEERHQDGVYARLFIDLSVLSPAEVKTATRIPVIWWCILALTLTYGAYVAEVYRAGIESIHWSQVSAARSLGLSYMQTMRYVVVPQAVRRIMAPLLNDFIGLQKDTALVQVVGVRTELSPSASPQVGSLLCIGVRGQLQPAELAARLAALSLLAPLLVATGSIDSASRPPLPETLP